MITQDIVSNIRGRHQRKKPLWSCKAEDGRGIQLAESLAGLNMEVLDLDAEPTYSAYKNVACQSIVNILACCTSMLHRVTDWRVDKDFCTLSDHRPIVFQIHIGRHMPTHKTSIVTKRYNTQKANWNKFVDKLRTKSEENNQP